jgi:alpha-ketoglutarate-dependent taurine dioxygenase
VAVSATPLSSSTGLEITGLSGDRLVDRAVADDCLAAVEAHGVVVYREADLDDEQLVAFAELLGPVATVPRGAVEGHPQVAPVTRDRSKDEMAAYRAGTFFWHIDGANDLVPNKLTLLTAKVIGGDEGDTEFANTYAAYEALSLEQKDELAGVRVVHSFAASQRLVHPDPTPKQIAAWSEAPSREHPLVWVRRDGRRSLLIGATTDSVVGRESNEGRTLLDGLLDFATRPQFVVRHSWRPGDLVIWDNTGMLHRALPYRSDSPRLMHRCTITGDEAIA